MAKQKLPDQIQKQFSKSQFKPGEAVYFTWLGQKKYGYVKETKERNWGIQYTVESEDVRYPCGIQIKTHKTTYTTGCIHFDETRSLGQQEIITRIQTGHSSTYSELFYDTRRTTVQSSSESGDSKRVSNKNSKTVQPKGSSAVGKNSVKSSSNGNTKGNRKKRENSELDTAIEKQRNFLNGFVKKD